MLATPAMSLLQNALGEFFSPLENRNFRIYILGQAVPLIGTVFIAPRVQRMPRAGFALVMMLLWAGLWLGITSFFDSAPFFVAGVFVYSISIPVVLAGVNALTQMLAPAAMRGRILSVSQMISFGAQPVGALMVGWIASGFGLMQAVRISGVALFVGALLLLLLRKDFRDRMHAPPDEQRPGHAATPTAEALQKRAGIP